MQSEEEETVQYTMRMIKERKANERARENDVEGAEKSRSSWFVLALATTYSAQQRHRCVMLHAAQRASYKRR